jgi:hypothetical protein
MKIQFTDLFNNESKRKFNISNQDVYEALNKPDKKELLDMPQIERSLVGVSSSDEFKVFFI